MDRRTYMIRKMKLWLLTGALLVFGCGLSPLRDPGSAAYVISVNEVVRVNKVITIESGHTRVFLQQGKIIDKQDLDEYSVNCNFEINTLADKPRYIKPGNFRVLKVVQRMDSVVRMQGQVQLASSDKSLSGLLGFRDSPMMFEEVRISLHSDSQTDVRELACRGAVAEMPDMRLPRRSEIEQALGDFASFEMK
ncbi:MAG: hypothetical protein OEY89_13770 [Gammaproteobacteria bacterium]|nr:hypothetical protein [Gammaproteobacteria bacterium]